MLGMVLTPENVAEFGGKHPRVSFEGPRKMALVRKTSRSGYLDERRVISGKLMRGVFYAKAANIFAHRAFVKAAKCSRQMDRMHACEFGEVCERESFVELRVKPVGDLIQPSRRPMVRSLNGISGSLGQQFQSKALDGESRYAVHIAEFVIKFRGQPDRRASLQFDGAFQFSRTLARVIEPVVFDLYQKVMARPFMVFGVGRVGRLKCQRERATRPMLSAESFGVSA